VITGGGRGVAGLLSAGLTACGTMTPRADAPLGGAAPSTVPAPESTTIVIRGFAFHPATLVADVGDVVVWRNDDATAHTATSGGVDRPDGRFAVRLDQAGAAAIVTVDQAGTFTYVCTLHRSMSGEVIVRAAR
jgi:plastocyanin